MTDRAFGPVTPEDVIPRSADDVQVFLVTGYVPGVSGVEPTFTDDVTVTDGAISFTVDDAGDDIELVCVVTDASGQVETMRLVVDSETGDLVTG